MALLHTSANSMYGDGLRRGSTPYLRAPALLRRRPRPRQALDSWTKPGKARIYRVESKSKSKCECLLPSLPDRPTSAPAFPISAPGHALVSSWDVVRNNRPGPLRRQAVSPHPAIRASRAISPCLANTLQRGSSTVYILHRTCQAQMAPLREHDLQASPFIAQQSGGIVLVRFSFPPSSIFL